MEWVVGSLVALALLAAAAAAGARVRRWWWGFAPLAVPTGFVVLTVVVAATMDEGECEEFCASAIPAVFALVSAIPAIVLSVVFFVARAVAGQLDRPSR